MKYKLQSNEQWDSLAIKHPPIYCPNCGSKFTKKDISDIASYWTDPPHNRKQLMNYICKGIGYDVYCSICKWDGRIEPISDAFIVEERNSV
jgi:hypothetical protein